MRKLLSMAMILVMAMVAPLLVGCGSDSGSNDNFISYPNSLTKKYEKINFTQVMSLGDVRGAEEYGSDWGKPIIIEEPSEIFVSGIMLKKIAKYDFFTHEPINDVGTVNYVGYFPLANIVAMRESGSININSQPNSSEAIKSFIDKILTNWDKGLDMQYDVTFTLNGSITSVKCNGEEPTPIPPQAKKVYLESFGNYQVNVTLDESEPKAVEALGWTLKVTCGNAVKYFSRTDNVDGPDGLFEITLNETGKSGKVVVTEKGQKQLKAGQTYVCTLENLTLVDEVGNFNNYVGDKEIVINIPEISNEELRLDPTEIPQFTTNEVIKPSPDNTGDSKPTELQKPMEIEIENKPPKWK